MTISQLLTLDFLHRRNGSSVTYRTADPKPKFRFVHGNLEHSPKRCDLGSKMASGRCHALTFHMRKIAFLGWRQPGERFDYSSEQL